MSDVASIDLDENTLQQLKQDIREEVLDELHSLVEIRADDPDRAGVEDIWIAGQPLGKVIESNRRKCTDVEKRVEATVMEAASTTATESDETAAESTASLTPMERLAALGEEHVAVANVTASVKRAGTIFEHFIEWSKKAPSGRVIKANLKTLLNTARRAKEQGTIT